MKKHGFTLAEVLVTLGIIGTITALTMPTFTSNMRAQKVGPTLAKAVQSFDQATEAIMDAEKVDSLNSATSTIIVQGQPRSVALTSSSQSFWNGMKNYLKGGIANGATATKFRTNDGITYLLSGSMNSTVATQFPKNDEINPEVIIDINGDDSPNEPAKDQFYFRLMGDGSLEAWGASSAISTNYWTVKCPKNTTVTGDNRKYCAGHVLENGLKVEYK